MKRTDPTQAAAYLARWASVARFEIEEMRATSMEVKLRQLSALVASRFLFPVSNLRASGEDDVRRRWHRIRAVCREQSGT